MIARAINPSVFGVLFNNWALVLAILLTTTAISGLTGWLLVRYSALPGATGAREALRRGVGNGSDGSGVRG